MEKLGTGRCQAGLARSEREETETQRQRADTHGERECVFVAPLHEIVMRVALQQGSNKAAKLIVHAQTVYAVQEGRGHVVEIADERVHQPLGA
jgi:hypothetical protein